jgi:hypothetical protein
MYYALPLRHPLLDTTTAMRMIFGMFSSTILSIFETMRFAGLGVPGMAEVHGGPLRVLRKGVFG